MRTNQINKLATHILQNIPGYMHKGRMLYACPMTHVLRGFYIEDSGFDREAFYVWSFFLPLYVPTTHVGLTFGKRLGEGGGKRWHLSDPLLRDNLLSSIQRDGLPFIDGLENPNDVVNAIRRLGVDSDPYKQEAIAYSLAMADDAVVAQESLECLTKSLNRAIPWQSEMRERAIQLTQKLKEDPLSARRQLAEWEVATVKSLGLGQ